MESSGTPGRVNISGPTYDVVKDFFECEYRGRVPAKGKGDVDMYFVNGIKAELSLGGMKMEPNSAFEQKYQAVFNLAQNNVAV